MSAYKLFCFFVVFAAVSTKVQGVTDEEHNAILAKMLPIIQECGKEFSITLEEITEWKKEKKDPDDTNSCMFACVFKKTGLLDDNGKFSEEGAIEKSKTYFSNLEDQQNVKEAAAICKLVNDKEVSDGEKGCDRAKLIYQCLKENADKFGFPH